LEQLLHLAIRRERADEKRDYLNRFIEVKRAARLIDAELTRAQAAAHICVTKRHWWTPDVAQLSSEAWQEHRAAIAVDLSDEAWTAVTISIEAADNIRVARDIATAAGLGAHAISDTTAETLIPMLRDIQLGRAALAPLTSSSLKTGR
jgi:hypothetical protein